MAEIEVKGIDELNKNLEMIMDKLSEQLKVGIEKAAINTAEDIKVIFKGGTRPGFQDRTGALRASIKGGIDDTREDIVGFISAGDDTPGTDGKPTREYVERVEFGEFSRAGTTSFLRAGVQQETGQIANIIKDNIDVEKLVG